MTEEQWNELLEIMKKAGLTPQPDRRFDSRFDSLKVYVSALNTLLNLSQENKERLGAQFKELSDQDQQDFLTRVRNKTHPGSFHLSDEEVIKLEAARKELSLHERARLSCGFIFANAGAAWIDLGEVSKAIVSIDCRSTPERVTRPYAHIYFSDFYKRRVETIDIIEAVKKDPLAIGHPAIAFAIYHWQQVIYTKRVIERDDIITRDGWGPYFKDEHRGGRDLKSAESSLREISPTLYDAAMGRSIPLESAFALRMQWCGLLQDLADHDSSSDEEGGYSEKGYEWTVVYKAWDKLRAESIAKLFKRDEIGNRSDPEEILKKLEPILDAYERVMERDVQPIYAHRVVEFLKDEGEKGGRRFVGLNKDGKSPGSTWKGFCHAFAAWYFDLDQSEAVAPYLRRAKKQNIVIDYEGKVIPIEVYKPSVLYPKASIAWIFTHLLTRPLDAVREPQWLNEHEITFDDMEDAITRSSNNQ